MRISNQANIPKDVAPKYKTEQSKQKTVAILGSSATTDKILGYMDICANSTKALISKGKNIVTSCANAGIMREAYKSGQKYSVRDTQNKPVQNLAIIANPLWGDEDLDNCIL